MSYDFSDVTKIVVPEGEVYKITNSSNSVIWRKPYVWAQYTVSPETTYSVSWATTSSTNTAYIEDGILADLEAWSGYKVTGPNTCVGYRNQYSKNNIIDYINSKAYETYPYVFLYNGRNRLWKVNGGSFTETVVKVYYYQGTLTSTTTEVRGTATGNIFLSNSPTAYPTNGVQNGYWYYRTQVGYTG